MRKLYVIPNASRIERSIELAERYGAGFEYNDFYLPDVLDNSARVDELIDFYKSLPKMCTAAVPPVPPMLWVIPISAPST